MGTDVKDSAINTFYFSSFVAALKLKFKIVLWELIAVDILFFLQKIDISFD